MHPIAMILGYVFGGSIISAIVLTALGYRAGYYRPNHVFMFICGCVGAGIAQAIAAKMAKKKKQKEAEESFKQKDKPEQDDKDYSEYFYD